MRECRPVFVGREKSQFGTNSTGPLLLDQFYWTNFYWITPTGTTSTDSTAYTGFTFS